MSISINATPVSGGSLTVSAVDASGVSVTTDTASAVNLTVGGGVGPPGAGNVALAAGDGILITSTANVATINCTVEGVPESVLENLSNVLSGNATTGDVLAWNGTTWAADSNFATLTYVDTAVANLVDAAPGALDTLNELAAAIGDDANFSATITTSLAGKAAANHTHNIADVTGLQASLDAKAATAALANVALTGNYSDLLNVPSNFASENHTHTSADITDFATAAALNAPLQTINGLTGNVVISNGTGLTLTASGSTLTLNASGGGVSSLDMGTYPRIGSLLTEGGDTLTSEAGDQISPEQSTETTSTALQLLRSNVAAAVPSSLAAGELAINSEDELLFYADSAGVVQSFALGGYAAANHTHAIANVTGLQATLDSKAATASLANVATSGNYTDLANIPSEFTPTSHASSHATGGSDALAPSDIGAAPAASPTFTGTITVSAGTAAAPALVASGDSNTGVLFPAADTFAISTAGAERLRVKSNGYVGVNCDPAYRFHVAELGGTEFFAVGQYFYIRQQNDQPCGFVVQNNNAGGGSSRGFWSFSIESGNAAANDFLIYNSSVSASGNHYFTLTTDGDFVVENAAGRIRSNFFTTSVGAVGDATIDLSGQVLTISTAGTERLRVDSSGNVGIGTTSPSASLDINSDKIRLRTTKTPASAGDTGNAGDICWDSSYLYICTATDTWRRIAHSTW